MTSFSSLAGRQKYGTYSNDPSVCFTWTLVGERGVTTSSSPSRMRGGMGRIGTPKILCQLPALPIAQDCGGSRWVWVWVSYPGSATVAPPAAGLIHRLCPRLHCCRCGHPSVNQVRCNIETLFRASPSSPLQSLSRNACVKHLKDTDWMMPRKGRKRWLSALKLRQSETSSSLPNRDPIPPAWKPRNPKHTQLLGNSDKPSQHCRR